MTEASRQAPGLLVAHQEARMRVLLGLALREIGCAVWLAADGPEARDVYRQQRGRIDLVLLDGCLPGLDGPATLPGLRVRNGQGPGCLLGTYRGGRAEDELAWLGRPRFFGKPLALAELVQDLWLSAAGEPLQLPRAAATCPDVERRAATRYRCQVQVFCRRIGELTAEAYWPGWLRDISVTGVRLHLGRRVEPGTILELQAWGRVGEAARWLLARVVRVAPVTEGRWELGCSFVRRLDGEELWALCS
jgi:CheY-like chemotaxis protein